MGHKERVYGDTTECPVCGKQWDTNDPEPPPCLSEAEQNQQRGKRWIRKLKEKLK